MKKNSLSFKMSNLKRKITVNLSVKRTSSNIFDFNHISKDLPEEIKQTLKEFYKFYHKKWWCYNKAFKRYKKKSLSLTILQQDPSFLDQQQVELL